MRGEQATGERREDMRWHAVSTVSLNQNFNVAEDFMHKSSLIE